jgi:hypothetical protein
MCRWSLNPGPVNVYAASYSSVNALIYEALSQKEFHEYCVREVYAFAACIVQPDCDREDMSACLAMTV